MGIGFWHLCRSPLRFGEFARFDRAAELFLLHLQLQPRLSNLHPRPPLTLAHRGPKVDTKCREGRPLTRASGLWSRASRLGCASSEIPGIYKRIYKVCESTRANVSPLATLYPPLFKFLLLLFLSFRLSFSLSLSLSVSLSAPHP